MYAKTSDPTPDLALAECREDISKVRGGGGGAAGSCNTVTQSKQKEDLLTFKTLFQEKVE